MKHSQGATPATPYWTEAEWRDIEHAARQARTYRAYEKAGRVHGNEAQRLASAGSARSWEATVRRAARAALASSIGGR